MKKIIFFPSLLLVVVAFVSCSKDKAPAHGQETVTFDIPFSVLIPANTSQTTVSTPDSTFTLSGVLSAANQDKANYVSSSTLSRADSKISFLGFTNTGATLSNISFSTTDNGIKSGTLVDAYNQPLVITADTVLGGDVYTTILGQMGDYLASKKSITLHITYKAGNQNITTGKINLHFSTVFSW